MLQEEEGDRFDPVAIGLSNSAQEEKEKREKKIGKGEMGLGCSGQAGLFGQFVPVVFLCSLL